jgi:hypothetical protein
LSRAGVAVAAWHRPNPGAQAHGKLARDEVVQVAPLLRPPPVARSHPPFDRPAVSRWPWPGRPQQPAETACMGGRATARAARTAAGRGAPHASPLKRCGPVRLAQRHRCRSPPRIHARDKEGTGLPAPLCHTQDHSREFKQHGVHTGACVARCIEPLGSARAALQPPAGGFRGCGASSAHAGGGLQCVSVCVP